ncbi:MAG TPA: hypothetical protein VIM81_19970 [Gammaproteobacteria bacterium]
MSFFVWLEQTGVSVWVREAPTLWAFPFVLFLHTLGLGVVAGLSVAMNVWILKFAERHPVAPLKPFFPIIWVGFTVNLISGLLLLAAYPTKALTDPVFYLKIGLIMIALFLLQWMRRKIFVAADPSRPLQPDRRLRFTAALSIGLWAGAVLTGRLLAYTYNFLMASDLVAGY